MLRVLEGGLVGGVVVRRLAVLGLLAVGGALAPLVVRARGKAALRRPASVEVARLEVGEGACAAIYEDGRLVGVLDGVDRL
jgi:hypothetical protein